MVFQPRVTAKGAVACRCIRAGTGSLLVRHVGLDVSIEACLAWKPFLALITLVEPVATVFGLVGPHVVQVTCAVLVALSAAVHPTVASFGVVNDSPRNAETVSTLPAGVGEHKCCERHTLSHMLQVLRHGHAGATAATRAVHLTGHGLSGCCSASA